MTSNKSKESELIVIEEYRIYSFLIFLETLYFRRGETEGFLSLRICIESRT